MIQVEDKIISLDILTEHFTCDLNACKGACCVEGDAGAPLEKEEVLILKRIYEKIKPYMEKKGIEEVDSQGFSVLDEDGDLTTPLINNRECAFVTRENGITKCSIEKANLEGKTNFKKPISCHLFPIRITKYRNFEAVNYEKVEICNPGCICGSKLKVPLYVFLKEPLIRKYGKNWHEKLSKEARLYKNTKNNF